MATSTTKGAGWIRLGPLRLNRLRLCCARLTQFDRSVKKLSEPDISGRPVDVLGLEDDCSPNTNRRRSDRCGGRSQGAALLDVLLALVLLALSGTALISLLGQTSHSLQRTQATEHLLHAASNELSALSLLSHDELTTHAGRRSHHGWTINIVSRGASLFDIDIAASDTTAPLLHTTLYRPDTTRER